MLGIDAHDCAEALLDRFGTIRGVMTASPAALRRTLSHWPQAFDAISAARQLGLTAAREQFFGERVSVTDPHFLAFLKGGLGKERAEQLFAAYLDPEGLYVGCDILAQGTVTKISVASRMIVHRVLDLDCASVILAHNHPSGLARASRDDMLATASLRGVLSAVDVRLIDHLIVTRSEVFSIEQGATL